MLTLQYVPYTEIGNLNTDQKIKKLLGLVKTNRILLVEGRLSPREETELIEKTMEQISKSFKGVEICTIYKQNGKNEVLWEKLRSSLLKVVLGREQGLTIIGPATIIKEIKRDPNKIELLTRNSRKK